MGFVWKRDWKLERLGKRWSPANVTEKGDGPCDGVSKCVDRKRLGGPEFTVEKSL